MAGPDASLIAEVPVHNGSGQLWQGSAEAAEEKPYDLVVNCSDRRHDEV